MSNTTTNFEKCRHFNGIQHDRCRAGIAYESVRDASQPGPYRWPCLALVGRPLATTTCACRSLLTAEEHAAREVEMRAVVDAAFAAIAAGKCHVCGADAEPSRIVGRCKYAACGHRIGQIESEEP